MAIPTTNSHYTVHFTTIVQGFCIVTVTVHLFDYYLFINIRCNKIQLLHIRSLSMLRV